MKGVDIGGRLLGCFKDAWYVAKVYIREDIDDIKSGIREVYLTVKGDKT
jgi:hypothetical protein